MIKRDIRHLKYISNLTFCILYVFVTQNINMVNAESKKLLEYFLKECEVGVYKVFEASELEKCLLEQGENVLNKYIDVLESQGCISVKYKDKKLYCLTISSQAINFAKKERVNNNKLQYYSKFSGIICFLVFIFAFLGSFLAIILYGLIF